MGQIEEVVARYLQLEILDVVVDDFRPHIAKLLHGELLVLGVDNNRAVLDQKIQVI